MVCCCIFNYLLPFILHRKGGFNCTTKPSIFSHPDYTVGSRFTLDQPFISLIDKRVAGLNYCRLGITPYPEDEFLKFYKYIIAYYSDKNNSRALF
ncbi:hypothetical protein UF66_0729 [Staphylococcus cohnii subsp. cohnii]|uniref:Uncharacterized protein n=1 Tax=Staphylococcus cohnii subsp. cohnii TaxID=74704 RepID=A0A0M2NUL1_STACC|nr:hypothetical protein UF66_0729 [Staphylococcus cohnii subsp. cohnii]